MLKLTKTGIGLLTKQYRSVLRKCLLLNLLFVQFSNLSYSVDHGAGYFAGWNQYYDPASDSDRVEGQTYILTSGRYSGYFSFKDFIDDLEVSISSKISLSELQNIQSLNYYYTFRVDERVEVIDSASFFQKDFSTLQEVDLHIKNPTHLRAFTKCDEACPRLSERFASSLIQEQMFKNDASVDAGTSRHCLRQFGDVVADLLKNTVAKSLRIYEFMNEEVCHA